MKNRVAELRNEKGISQAELARMVKVTRYHINKIEKGKVNMSIPLAVRIANVLDVSLNDIFLEQCCPIDKKGVDKN